jgi:hypothetical protein
MTSIIKPWVAELGLRHQGVLVSAIRGPDGIPREDPIKTLVRIYRGHVLRAFCGDVKKATSYMVPFNEEVFESASRQVLKNLDHYNLHFFLHFTHAIEIMGYYSKYERDSWLWLYENICRKMHINSETKEQLDLRLGASEEVFGSQQQ